MTDLAGMTENNDRIVNLSRLLRIYSPIDFTHVLLSGGFINGTVIDKKDDLIISSLPWLEEMPGADPGNSFADIEPKQ